MLPIQIEQMREEAQSITDLLGSPADEATFDLLDGTVVHSYTLREMSGILLSLSLAIMRDRWDEWPLTAKGIFSHKFSEYAYQRTHYAPATVDNLVRAGRVWLRGLPRGIPENVVLYDRDGEPTGEIVTADPFRLSVSKLVQTAAAAQDGRLGSNEIARGQLFNPEVPVRVVNDTLQGRDNCKGDDCTVLSPVNDETLKFYVEGPFIMVRKGEKRNWVAELNVEDFAKDPLVKEAIRYLIMACQVKGWEV